MPLMLPVSAAVWMSRLSSCQYSLAHFLAVCWTLLGAARNVLRVFSLGEHIYSARAARFASMAGVISADFASNQSELRGVVFPKMASADVWMHSRRWIQVSDAVLWGFFVEMASSKVFANSSIFASCCTLMVLMRGFPWGLARWRVFGVRRILQHTYQP